MSIQITQQNLEALRPLYKPWEQPNRHRVRGAVQPQAGRRPSNCDLVRSVRRQVDDWRDSGYLGASDTSKLLLQHWFQNDHIVEGPDGPTPFTYNWAQREAIETLIYLYEVATSRNLGSLLVDLGGEKFQTIADGLDPRENAWARYCFKIATGGGKTKAMSLVIVWSYFHRLLEPGSEMPQHFLIIAPGITVYERLKDDFQDLKVFQQDPVLPPEWKSEFLLNVKEVMQDQAGGETARGVIYVSNIHQLYASRDEAKDDETTSAIFGPPVKRAKVYDGGASLRQRIAAHGSIMVLNDEAHHLHDPDLAWNTAIETLHTQMIQVGQPGVVAQLDFTATPKHNDGKLFRHIVCDFPLGEAVDAGIVKVPVIGESTHIAAEPDKTLPAEERFRTHLQVGYELWKSKYEALKAVRTPILFVMTEDTDAADKITSYLDSEAFPELMGRVLNVHTNLKVKKKQVTRNGRKETDWIEKEMNEAQLQEVRRLSRELDQPKSKYRCVVSVLMLREGWDVKNVTTIVPLRAYSAASNILPEQTLGRGLRRMFPGSDDPEIVSVVHHPAFEKLYEEALAQEGFELLTASEPVRDSITIYVDHANRRVEDLELIIPRLSDAVVETLDLSGLAFEAIREYALAKRYGGLSIGQPHSGAIEYTERHLFSDEIVSAMQIDLGLLQYAWSAVDFYAKLLERACHVSGQGSVLRVLVKRFVEEVLFERAVDIHSGEVDHRMREADVRQRIQATFAPLIKEHTRHVQERKSLETATRVSLWKPFAASVTDRRPAIPAERTMFNLVPCANDFERRFAEFCSRAEDVVAFAKNAGPQKHSIDYLKSTGDRGLYWPDFIVRAKVDVYYLVETKGQEDKEVSYKAASAVEWCKRTPGGKWQYVFVPQHVFDQAAVSRTIKQLHSACAPALTSLLDTLRTYQQELPFEEAKQQGRKELLYTKLLERAGISSVHESLAPYVAQAAETLQFSIDSDHPRLAPAFSALWGQVEALCHKILLRVGPHMPTDYNAIRAWFETTGWPQRERSLAQCGRTLRDMLVHGNARYRTGTLVFCLEVANQWQIIPPGVWQAVKTEFASPAFAALHTELNTTNEFRNNYVSHDENDLTDTEVARIALAQWTRCLAMLYQCANT
jgi:type III restriction enzyme